MALRTLGTNAVNSLSAFVVGPDDVIAANLALLNLGIRADQASVGNMAPVGSVRFRVNQPYVKKGVLHVPNRGYLHLREGDYIAFDATTGWPIVISADAIASGPYTHS